MSKKLGDTATPLGAPPVVVADSDKKFYEDGRPRLGGIADPVRFDSTEEAVVNAVADTMIPPGEGFPAPSEVDIAGFFGRYVTPTGFRTKHYPFVEEDRLKEALSGLGSAFAEADVAARTERLRRLEVEDEELFGQLRSLVYYGYYAAPAVTLAIRERIPYGRDYHGAPLPYGYIDCIEDWDDEALSSAGQGTYVPTDEVERVDLGPIEWYQRRITDEEE